MAEYRSVLQKYSLKVARDYLKTLRRLEKERKNEEFLLQKMAETDNELVQAIADYMPLGIGLQLRNGETGFFLGDVKWGPNNRNSGFGLLCKNGNLYIVLKTHIRAFAESDASIATKAAQELLELVSAATVWDEVYIDGCAKPVLKVYWFISSVTLFLFSINPAQTPYEPFCFFGSFIVGVVSPPDGCSSRSRPN